MSVQNAYICIEAVPPSGQESTANCRKCTQLLVYADNINILVDSYVILSLDMEAEHMGLVVNEAKTKKYQQTIKAFGSHLYELSI